MNLILGGLILDCLLILTVASARRVHQGHHHSHHHNSHHGHHQRHNNKNNHNRDNSVALLSRARRANVAEDAADADEYAVVLLRLRHSAKRHVAAAAADATTTTAPPFAQPDDGAAGECERSYVNRITEHCRYPGMNKPCFAQLADGASLSAQREFVDAISGPVRQMARTCCADGRRCSTQEFEKLCCRTPACLERCYGANWERGRKKIGMTRSPAARPDGEAAAADCTDATPVPKIRRGKSHFRFLDILTRPNPSRQRQRHFEDDYAADE